jgi:hypothetical protein
VVKAMRIVPQLFGRHLSIMAVNENRMVETAMRSLSVKSVSVFMLG